MWTFVHVDMSWIWSRRECFNSFKIEMVTRTCCGSWLIWHVDYVVIGSPAILCRTLKLVPSFVMLKTKKVLWLWFSVMKFFSFARSPLVLIEYLAIEVPSRSAMLLKFTFHPRKSLLGWRLLLLGGLFLALVGNLTHPTPKKERVENGKKSSDQGSRKSPLDCVSLCWAFIVTMPMIDGLILSLFSSSYASTLLC